MSAMQRRRRYDKQFKLEAVRLYMEEGLSTKYVEQKLGIGKGVVYDWIKRFADNSDHTRYIKGNSTQRDNELQKLRRELVRVKREREILKKAIVIFSKDLYRFTHS